VDAVSNGFLVDETPPEIKFGPKFKRDFGLVENTQFHRSSFKVEWDVDDPESHIDRQYLSVKSHIGGYFDLFSTQVSVYFPHHSQQGFTISSIKSKIKDH
jgi:hypothetical protein